MGKKKRKTESGKLRARNGLIGKLEAEIGKLEARCGMCRAENFILLLKIKQMTM